MPNPFVHIELQTHDLARAKTFYTGLFDWSLEDIPQTNGHGSYTMVQVGNGTGGGMMVAADPAAAPHWLPYVSVDDLRASTDLAQRLGAAICVDCMQIGNYGWITVLTDPAGARLGMWQAARPATGGQ